MVKNNTTLFSIIIISYNSANTLNECINSCLNQKYDNIEVIFVDDGSTDNTRDIVSDIAQKDSRVKYIYQENKGSNKARINGYRRAQGEYISFLDSDDFIDESLITKVANQFNINPTLDMVIFDYCRVLNKKIIKEEHNYKQKEYRNYDFLEDILKRNTPQYIVNKCYKRSFLYKVRFDEIAPITMGDDLAASVKMGLFQPNAIAIEDNLYFYTMNANSVSSKPNKKYVELIKMMQIINDYLIQYNLNERYSELLEYNYFILFCNYVVENKYKHTYIQQQLYDMWKKQKIDIKANKYIKSYMEKRNCLWKALVFITDKSLIIGHCFSRLYGLTHR